jgi:hypothetical protein
MTKDWNKNMRKRSHKHVSLLFLSQRENHSTGFEESLFILCSEHCKEETNKCSSNFGNHTIAIGSKQD